MLATKTWDGEGTTDRWTEAASWSEDTVPTAGGTVTFDTSSKNATIDVVNLTVASFHINTGYKGTISQGASHVTTGSGSFIQSDGTYNTGAGTFTFGVNYLHALVGGDFVCGAGGTVTFEGAAFRQTGGTFDCSLAAALNVTSLALSLDGGIVFSRLPGDVFSTNTKLLINGATPGTLTFFNVSSNLAPHPSYVASIADTNTMRVLGDLNFTIRRFGLDSRVTSLDEGGIHRIHPAIGE